MNFHGALQELNKGSKVRRERWNQTFYIYKQTPGVVIRTNTDMIALDGFLLSNDILAEDWEIYEEEGRSHKKIKGSLNKIDVTPIIKIYGGVNICVEDALLIEIDEHANFIIHEHEIEKLRFNLVIKEKEKKERKVKKAK